MLSVAKSLRYDCEYFYPVKISSIFGPQMDNPGTETFLVGRVVAQPGALRRQVYGAQQVLHQRDFLPAESRVGAMN
jgi:hypothetical protein